MDLKKEVEELRERLEKLEALLEESLPHDKAVQQFLSDRKGRFKVLKQECGRVEIDKINGATRGTITISSDSKAPIRITGPVCGMLISIQEAEALAEIARSIREGRDC